MTYSLAVYITGPDCDLKFTKGIKKGFKISYVSEPMTFTDAFTQCSICDGQITIPQGDIDLDILSDIIGDETITDIHVGHTFIDEE